MSVTKLTARQVKKVWGRRDLSPWFDDVPEGGEPVGEIWFEMPDGRDVPLLLKYLFTSERLSVQVHPDDETARAAGHGRGKDEAWLVLDAEPRGTVGLGTVRALSAEQLRAAALDGSIEKLIDWKSVKSGDFIYSPAGTVHAIGPGVTLVEVQQNIDLTYRLYDYGRPRELHLEAAVAASNARPFVVSDTSRPLAGGRTAFGEGGKFVLERVNATGANGRLATGRPLWLLPLAGETEADGIRASAGEVLYVEGETFLESGDAIDLLVAYEGRRALGSLTV